MESKWVFKGEADTLQELETSKKHPDKEIKWTASEFIHHHKNLGWYLGLILATLAFSGITYLVTKDVISSSTILLVGVLFGVLASKKPRELPYSVNNQGVTIGQKFYPYTIFRSFAVNQEGAIACVEFMPLKRFMPEIAIYFPPDQGTKILDLLSDHLPHEQFQMNGVDKLMKKVRF